MIVMAHKTKVIGARIDQDLVRALKEYNIDTKAHIVKALTKALEVAKFTDGMCPTCGQRTISKRGKK
jgi:hypothetical protein